MTSQQFSKEQQKEIAANILIQLGGRRFKMMTGAKNFLYGDGDLRMDLRSNKAKVNRLLITYDQGSDTYTMYFYRGVLCRKTFDYKVTREQTFEDVYSDQLQSIFTSVTGMYTKL